MTRLSQILPSRGAWISEEIGTENITGVDTVLGNQLNQVPADATAVMLFLNGQRMTYGPGEDFEIIGQGINWLADTGTAPDMTPADQVHVYYNTPSNSYQNIGTAAYEDVDSYGSGNLLRIDGYGTNLSNVVKSGEDKSRAQCYLTAAGSTNTAVAGTWYSWSGTFGAGTLQDFTHSNGVLTYTGLEQKVFKVSYSGVHRASGSGTPSWIDVGISINDNDPDTETIRLIKGAGSSTEQALETYITLNENDDVRVKVEGPTGADGTTTVFFDLICAMTIIE